MATRDLLRPDAVRSSLGDPRLLLERRSAAFMVAAAANEWVEGRCEKPLSWWESLVVAATSGVCIIVGTCTCEGSNELRSGDIAVNVDGNKRWFCIL